MRSPPESSRTIPRGSLAQAAAGFRLPLEGARLLLRERRLWAPALVPFLLSFVTLAAVLAGLISWAGPLYAWATGWLPELNAASPLSWLWVGPAKLAIALLGAALFLAAAALGLTLAFLLAGVLAAPFHDALSRRVEALLGRDTKAPSHGILRDGLFALREELRRTCYFAALFVPLALLGLLVPPLQALTAPALFALTLFFLPLDYASYSLDRRRVSFAAKRRWLRAHAPATLGFGAAAFLACSIPGANLLAMPFLVVGGTLLALRYEA
jgi:uncharacterized protein involved in cysteine biosynthesis